MKTQIRLLLREQSDQGPNHCHPVPHHLGDIFLHDANLSFRILTVMILNFQTHKLKKTVQTQIRLLLEAQSDQGIHCL